MESIGYGRIEKAWFTFHKCGNQVRYNAGCYGRAICPVCEKRWDLTFMIVETIPGTHRKPPVVKLVLNDT